MQWSPSRVAALVSLVLTGALPTQSQAQSTGTCEAGERRPATRVAVGAAFVVGNAVLYEYHRRSWWSGYRTDFHVVNDWDRAYRDQDKLAHAQGGYHLARVGADLLRAACVNARKAMWIAAAHAAAVQLQIEIWDGMQLEYGFSPPDLVANTVGTGYAVAQHFAPRLRAVKPTMSYASTVFARHPEAWPAGTQASFSSKDADYAGHTYWLSTDVDSLLPAHLKPYWPALVRVSVGHSITDWMDPVSGNIVRGQHEIVLSLDLDVEKLPGDHPVWREVKKQLSHYRLPGPALVIAPRLSAAGWYR